MERLTFTKEFKEQEQIGWAKYVKPEILAEWDKKLSALEDAEEEGYIHQCPNCGSYKTIESNESLPEKYCYNCQNHWI